MIQTLKRLFGIKPKPGKPTKAFHAYKRAINDRVRAGHLTPSQGASLLDNYKRSVGIR